MQPNWLSSWKTGHTVALAANGPVIHISNPWDFRGMSQRLGSANRKSTLGGTESIESPTGRPDALGREVREDFLRVWYWIAVRSQFGQCAKLLGASYPDPNRLVNWFMSK